MFQMNLIELAINAINGYLDHDFLYATHWIYAFNVEGEVV